MILTEEGGDPLICVMAAQDRGRIHESIVREIHSFSARLGPLRRVICTESIKKITPAEAGAVWGNDSYCYEREL